MSSTQSAEALDARFGIRDAVRFETTPSGLVRAIVATPQAEAHVYLHGAQVTHYQPRGEAPVLFLSARSAFAPGQAIRGGVPIIFPWFGAHATDPAAPMHGFARAAAWDLESAERAPDGSVTLAFRLTSADASHAAWPHDFLARYRVGIGAALAMTLEVHNASPDPVTFEEALHTYLAVADVETASITGLAGTTYIDKTDGMARKTEGPGALRLAGETDRVYLGTASTCVVADPAGARRLVVDTRGSSVTVVWNPWADKARAMSDLGAEDWRRFVCVETANAADHAVTLGPGERHAMRAGVRAAARQ